MTKNITVIIDGWKFMRASGAYIDIYAPGADAPIEVINHYDYDSSRPTANTAEQVRAKAQAWLDEQRGPEGNLHRFVQSSRECGFHRPRQR